jgi:FkbM family methyltransferase
MAPWEASPGGYDELTYWQRPPSPLRRESFQTWLWVRRHGKRFEWLKRRLVDDASRRVVDDILLYRILGRDRAGLGIGEDALRELHSFIPRLVVQTETADLHFTGWSANRYDLAPVGVTAQLDLHPVNVIHTFMLRQYEHPEFRHANARPGDVVIDGGSCWGDTAIYYASQSGEAGTVIGFELEEHNLRVLEGNLQLNPGLAGRIHVRKEALWSSCEDRLSFTADGPASRIGAGRNGRHVVARTIDSLVDEHIVERVDLIKLDIEGAELAALQGAIKTLERDRPRLAVALYHRPMDLFDIPRWLHDRFGGMYRMAITHRWIDPAETMLFAWTLDPART